MQQQQVIRWHNTREFKFGAGIGALVLTYAGAAWAFVALANRAGMPRWEFGVFALPVLTLTALSVVRLVAVAKLPIQTLLGAEATERARQGRRMGILFALVFATEAALVAGTAVILARSSRPLLIPVAVMAIFGLHLVPLARIFSMPIYMVTGSLLAGLAASSLLIAEEPLRIFILAMVAAVVLWASAARVLAAYTIVQSISSK
ncbi:MAG: hypothetical protein WA736_03895 [Candidatus Acidiferrum sp.]